MLKEEIKPVTLPGRMEPHSHLSQQRHWMWNGGWNACLDEIAKLGPLYTRPVQGEPVGYLVQRVDPTGVPRLDRPLITLCKPEEWGSAFKAQPLYTHADPGEIERLRTSTDHYCKLANEVIGERDTLRAQLAELKTAFTESQEEVVKRGKMLAEQDALLRAVPVIPKSADRRPNDEDQPDGYLEGDRSWCDNNKDAVEWLIENHAAIHAALSASAERRASKCDRCEDQGKFPIMGVCPKCGTVVNSKSSLVKGEN